MRKAIGSDEGQAGSVEHASLSIDRFVVVLGLHQRMHPAEAFDDVIHMLPVPRDVFPDLIGIDGEYALTLVAFRGLPGGAHFPGKEGVRGPSGARKDPSGIGAGGHRLEVLVVGIRADVLGFVHEEGKRSSGTDDIGGFIA